MNICCDLTEFFAWNVNNVIKYGHDELIVDIVISALKAKDLKLRPDTKSKGLSFKL